MHDVITRASSFKKNPLPQLQSGNCFRRLLTARTIASLTRRSAWEVVARMWPSDRVLAEIVERAASAPAMTSVAGWAAELAQKRIVDTLEALGPVSAAADVMKQCLTLDWDGAGVISAPGFVANAANSGFVAEGQPIPVRQLNAALILLTPFKLATIAVLTREMLESSNAEQLIGDALVLASGLALDAVFFGAAAATAAQPAGIRNGIAALTASASTDSFGAVFEDVSALFNAVGTVGGRGPFILVASVGRSVSFGMRIGRFPTVAEASIIPFASNAVGNDLIAIAPHALVAAIGTDPNVETASAATLVMDTAPVTPDTTQATKEMFQTDSVAVKVRWPVSWTLRNPAGLAWLTPIWK